MTEEAKIPTDTICHGSCLEMLESFPDKCVDAVISDFPFGITNAKRDVAPPLDRLWPLLHRLSRGVVVTTATQPFTSKCVMTNLANFRFEIVWRKNRGSGFLNCNRQVMPEHNSILVFCEHAKYVWNPQMEGRRGTGVDVVGRKLTWVSNSESYRKLDPRTGNLIAELRVPSSVQDFDIEVGIHPHQKPVSLGRWLVKSFTNPGNLVLDPYCGCGSFCLAAQLEGRHFIGIDIQERWVEAARKRVAEPFFPELASSTVEQPGEPEQNEQSGLPLD